MKFFTSWILLSMILILSNSCLLIPRQLKRFRDPNLSLFSDKVVQFEKIASEERIAIMRIEFEAKRLAYEDLNREADRAIEEKRLAHEDLNRKAAIDIEGKRIFAVYVILIIFAFLSVFFGRGGGENFEKVLVAVRDFQSSIHKLLHMVQVVFYKHVWEFVIPKFVWVFQKWGLFR